MEEQKNSLKMMLSGVLKCLSSCKLERLSSCLFVVDAALKLDWTILDVRPLRVDIDEILAHLDNWRSEK